MKEIEELSLEELLDYCIANPSPLLPEGVTAYKAIILTRFSDLQKRNKDLEKENKLVWEGIEALRKRELTLDGFLSIFPLGKPNEQDIKWADEVIKRYIK